MSALKSQRQEHWLVCTLWVMAWDDFWLRDCERIAFTSSPEWECRKFYHYSWWWEACCFMQYLSVAIKWNTRILENMLVKNRCNFHSSEGWKLQRFCVFEEIVSSCIFTVWAGYQEYAAPEGNCESRYEPEANCSGILRLSSSFGVKVGGASEVDQGKNVEFDCSFACLVNKKLPAPAAAFNLPLFRLP